MRALLLLAALLCACTTSKERAKRYMRDHAMSGECLREEGRYSDITFCVADRVLVVCTDWCMEVPLDEVKR